MAAKFQQPSEFDFVPEHWHEWVSRYERYRVLSKQSKEEGEYQVNSFLYCMGSQSESIFSSFTFQEDKEKSYADVKAAFDRYFSPKRYIIFERAKFYKRDQQPGETVEQYVRALNEIARKCDFGEKRSEQMRDKIVVGILDQHVSKEMQKMDAAQLTEDVAINMARQAEQVDKNMKELFDSKVSSVSPQTATDAVNQKPKPAPRSARKSPPSSNNSEPCTRCGHKVHIKGSCPALDSICKACNAKGHYARCCRTKSVHDVTESKSDDTTFSGFIGAVEDVNVNPWLKEICVGRLNATIKFKLDSGADVSIIPRYMCNHIDLYPSDKELSGPSGSLLKVLGYFESKIGVDQTEIFERIYVVDGRRPLLSRTACVKLGLIQCLCELDQVSNVNSDQKFKEEFKSLFQGLGKMHRVVDIELALGSGSAYAVHTPRSVPYPLLDKVKSELQDMVDNGVIFEVQKPTEWVSPMVVVPKPNDRVRICVDYTQLNKVVRREVFPMSHVEGSLAKLGNGRVFSKLDANSGFYQIPLSEKSKLLTTFLTPFGRYAYNRLPFGLSSSPEIYSKLVSEVLRGLAGVVVHMDDVCVWGQTEEEHDARVREVLKRMSEAGMTLNDSKCQFSRDSIHFLGHVISGSGIKPSPDSVQGIRDFPTPRSVTEVRSFLGMANQLSRFTPVLGSITDPLRELLCRDVAWYWGPAQESAFHQIKNELCRSVELAAYNSTYKTLVQTDASRSGLGAVLLQEQPTGLVRVVAAASRSLTETEKRYATIEQEALGIVWALEKFRDYIVGLRAIVQTDHKPLVPLLNEIELGKLPVRIQRFRMRLMRFDYFVEFISGKSNIVADALSRSGAKPSTNDVEFVEEVEGFVLGVLKANASADRLLQLRKTQLEDEVLSQVMSFVSSEWPSYLSVDQSVLRPYFENRSKLSIVDGLLVYEGRIVIPLSLRLEILEQVHKGHLGITKCRERARHSIWWPRMSQMIAEMVRNCEMCRKHSNVIKEPLMRSDFPQRPWERIGSDLFFLKKEWYVLLVDYYSRYIEIARLEELNSRCLIQSMKSVFARHGIPEIMISDNGPQYASEEFKKFTLEYSFKHVTSSPGYAPANGAAERAVQTVKNMLKKEDDPYAALLAYRSSPLENGHSPAELLMNRKLRTTVPSLPAVHQPQVPDGMSIRENEQLKRKESQVNHDSHHRAVELPPLISGESVYIRDTGRDGEVVNAVPNAPRSYVIKDCHGSVVRRNRKSLVSTPINPSPPLSPVKSVSTSSPQSSPLDPTTPARTFQTRSGRVVQPPKKLDL